MNELHKDPRIRLILFLVVIASVFLFVTFGLGVEPKQLQKRFQDIGPLAPIIFIVVSAACSTFFIPGPVLAAASGLLFGVVFGTAVSISAMLLSATLSFGLSRWWAKNAVERLIGPRLKALSAWVGDRGFWAIFYTRLIPGVPYTTVNYAAGITSVRFFPFLLATAIAGSPRSFAYTALGGSFGNFTSPAAIAAFVTMIVMTIGGFVLMRVSAHKKKTAKDV